MFVGHLFLVYGKSKVTCRILRGSMGRQVVERGGDTSPNGLSDELNELERVLELNKFWGLKNEAAK